MIKKSLALLSSLVLFTSANALDKLNEKQIKDIESLGLFKNVGAKVNVGYDIGSLYMLNISVKGGVDKIFLTKDKKYLIPSDIISTKDGSKFSVPADLSILKGKEAFSYGSGKEEFVLFTDPECPYCDKFESYFPQIKDKVTLKVFLYPLSFHKNAKDLSLYYMSKNTDEAKAKALLSVDAKSKEFIDRKIDKTKLKKLEKHLEEQMKIASSLGVQGTPTLFDSKGNKVSWVALLQRYGIAVK